MTADDQRAAEPATPDARLRTILDDVTAPADMRDDLRAVLDRAAEVDRLRAELAETRAEVDRMRDVARTEDAAKRDAMVTADVWKMRADRLATAGDALADAAEDVIDCPTEAHLDDLGAAAEAWRALRAGVPAPDRAGDDEPRPGGFCCQMMAGNSVASCTEHADNPASCPDVTIAHSDQHGPGLPIPNSAGGGQISIRYCPWCRTDLRAGGGHTAGQDERESGDAEQVTAKLSAAAQGEGSAAPADDTAGQDEPRGLAVREDDLAEGMQRAWDDWIGDVGHIPEDFTVSPKTAKVSAEFVGGSFARSVLGYLRSVTAPADDTAAPDHPLPWRVDGTGQGRGISDANGTRVGWMHPPELAAALVSAVNRWGRRAIGVPVAVLDALPDRDPFAAGGSSPTDGDGR